MLDPVSAVGGAATTGSVLLLVLKWLMSENSAMRKWMEKVTHDQTVAQVQLATSLTELKDAMELRVEVERELLLVLKERHS